jgi:hypothetical protein
MVNIGTEIYTSIIQPGMIVELPDGTSFPVEDKAEGYDTWTLTDGVREIELEYGALVTVLGYFNPENGS